MLTNFITGPYLDNSSLTLDQELDIPQSYANPPEFRPEVAPVDFEEAIGVRAEQNYIAAEERRWKQQKYFMGDYYNAMRFTGILHAYEIFRRLQRVGVDARIEPPIYDVWLPDDTTGKPVLVQKTRSSGRFWLHDYVIAGRVGVSAWVIDNGKRIAKTITTLQFPYSPEWSLVQFDEFDVPLRERYRGWRTALLALILQGVLTEDEVNRAFGPVALTPISMIYRERIYHYRQKKAGLIA